MAVISFSREDKHAWVVAGWAFRQVLEDTAMNSMDPEIIQEFKVAEATKYLLVESLEPRLAEKITREIQRVASEILSENIRSGIHDKPWGNSLAVEQYYQGLRELLAAMPEGSA